MKRSLLWIILLLSVNAECQSLFHFPRTGMQYGEIYFGDWTMNFRPQQLKYQYTTDTLIAGRIYSKFILEFDHYTYPYPFYYTSYDSGKVYRYYSMDTSLTGTLIYDFNLQMGDTIRFDSWGEAAIGLSIGGELFELMNVSLVTLLNNETRKLYTFEYAGDTYYGITNHQNPDTIRWMDGIGDIDRGLFYTSDIEGGREAFVCARDSSGILWINSDYPGACDTLLISSITDNPHTFSYNISPNPATTYLNIQLQQTPTAATMFELFDLTGRMVLQQPLTATTNHVELNGVSKGMYLYKVVSEKQRAGAGKLIIE